MSTSISGSPAAQSSTEQRRDISPAPIQTFHKEKLPYLPSTHLIEGVTGAAHFYSPCLIEEENVPGSPKIHHRHSSIMSNPPEPEVILEGKKRQVLDDVMALFCAKPTAEIFERSFREDAIFEDPISKCLGYKEYASQWFGVPKLFATSITKSYRILSSTTNPNRITYHQEQEYTFRVIGTKKLIVSTVEIDLDEDDMITHLQDKWNGKEQSTNFIVMALRRLNAKMLLLFISVPSLKKDT